MLQIQVIEAIAMKKVLFIDEVHPALMDQLLAAGFSCDFPTDWTLQDYLLNLPQYQGVVIRSKFKFDKPVIDRALQLKFIARFGAGMENIDVDYAQSKGIKCLHAPEGNKDAVGEHALGMLLALMNNLCRADREVRKGIWKREPNRGVELSGKVVGIIGFGNMGTAFAQKISGFGCEVLVYDKYKKGFGQQFSSVKKVEMDTLFEKAEVVSLHLPLTAETKALVDMTWIEKFRKSFYFINTARGPIVKTDALVKGLKSGKVVGACLDVSEFESTSFEQFNAPSDEAAYQYLLSSDRVVLSPHIAGWTHESNLKMANALAQKIIALT